MTVEPSPVDPERRFRSPSRRCGVLPWLLGACLAGTCLIATWACGAPPAEAPTPSTSPSPPTDLSAIDAFWPLYETWRRGEEPAPELWEALLETPAYRYLTEVENRERWYRTLFPAVFMPGNPGLAEALEARPGIEPLVEHYRRVIDEEGALRDLAEEMRSGRILAEARTLADELLPQEARDDPWWPTLSVEISHPDGTSYRGRILVDLLILLDRGPEGRPRFVAHEMHHAYVTRLWPAAAAPEGAERALHALDQLRLEGAADLVDKIELARDLWPADYRERYLEAYDRSPEILGDVDALLAVLFEDPARVTERSEALWRALPFAGHPTGRFMARTILEESGHARLLVALQSPTGFVRAYQEAAELSNAPVLTEGALAALERFESSSTG